MQKVLFNKVVPVDYFKLTVRHDSCRKKLHSIESKVIQGWDLYVSEMAKKGVRVWNGQLYRLENGESDKLELVNNKDLPAFAKSLPEDGVVKEMIALHLSNQV